MRKARTPFFTLHELLVIAALAALGGITSSAVSMLRATAPAFLPIPGAMQTLAGIHVLWLIVILGVVPKPGAATAVGLLKGVVELLAGNPHGLFAVALAGLAGLTVDAVWLLCGRSDRRSTYLLAGALGAASNVFVQALSASLPGHRAVRGGVAALAVVAAASGLVLAGALGWWLVRMLRRAGVAGAAATAEATGAARVPLPPEPANDDGPLIQFEHFGWQFGGAVSAALSDVSLTIQRGEFVVVTGPSGSGKSTAALAMCGLLVGRHAGEARGRVAVAGRDVAHLPLHRIAETVGLVQQNPDAQFATLTVDDEVAFGLENRCRPAEEIRRAGDEALSLLGISALRGRTLATLSGGEKQRVAIASLMAGHPAAIVLDEPTASLDPPAARALFATLAEICRRARLTVVIVEHKLMHLLPLRPRLIALDEGRVLTDVPPEHVATRDWLPVAATAGPPIPTASSAAPLVDVSEVTVRLGGRTVLDRVSLRVERGETVAVLGPNGGGKTTLLHCLLGIVSPAAGVVLVCDNSVSSATTSRLARNVGLVFQNADHQLVADTVWHEALFASHHQHVNGAAVEAEAERLLRAAGVYPRKQDHPYRLSWGQKRRLNLVAAILHRPAVLLLDEPFAGQDWGSAAFVLDAIRGVLDGTGGAARGACLMVTHDVRVAALSCARVVFLDGGRIIVDAPTAEAFQRLRTLGHTAYLPGGEHTRASNPA